MQIVSVLYLIAGIVGMISCLIILVEFINIYKPITEIVSNYLEVLNLYFHDINIIQPEKFFLMVNKGEDLCEKCTKIPYVDYMNDSNLFLGGKK